MPSDTEMGVAGDKATATADATTATMMDAQAADGEQKRSMTQNIIIGVLLLLLIILAILLGLYGVSDAGATPIRVLFVGNSFTYGPGDAPNMEVLHNLPEMYKKLGESMGYTIETGEDTIGGCILNMHVPEKNPEKCKDDGGSCNIVENPRVVDAGYDDCSIPTAQLPESDYSTVDSFSPCPQMIRYEDWDYVVLQEHSAVPTVPEAAKTYMYPAYKSYKDYMKKNLPDAKLVAYMTWSYYNGSLTSCPGGGKPNCFPEGLTGTWTPDCADSDEPYRKYTSALNENVMENSACMTHNVATSYMQMFDHGADMVAPVGLAWNAVRGAEPLPKGCKAEIDDLWGKKARGYPMKMPKVGDVSAIAGKDHGMVMYRDTGDTEKGKKYCTGDCTIDHHASAHGMYMSANVILATTLGISTKTASYRPENVNKEQAELIRKVASDVVLENLDVWSP